MAAVAEAMEPHSPRAAPPADGRSDRCGSCRRESPQCPRAGVGLGGRDPQEEAADQSKAAQKEHQRRVGAETRSTQEEAAGLQKCGVARLSERRNARLVRTKKPKVLAAIWPRICELDNAFPAFTVSMPWHEMSEIHRVHRWWDRRLEAVRGSRKGCNEHHRQLRPIAQGPIARMRELIHRQNNTSIKFPILLLLRCRRSAMLAMKSCPVADETEARAQMCLKRGRWRVGLLISRQKISQFSRFLCKLDRDCPGLVPGQRRTRAPGPEWEPAVWSPETLRPGRLAKKTASGRQRWAGQLPESPMRRRRSSSALRLQPYQCRGTHHTHQHGYATRSGYDIPGFSVSTPMG